MTMLLRIPISLVLCFIIMRQLVYTRRRRSFKQEYGCMPVRHLTTWYDVFGLGLLVVKYKQLKEGTILANHVKQFRDTSTFTLEYPCLWENIIITIEPGNLRVIQDTDRDRWSLGKRRTSAFERFIGKGIFTNEGYDWQHSREMLRPSFRKLYISDLSRLKVHVDGLIHGLENDRVKAGICATSLQERFFRLTMDITSELLWGKSTYSQNSNNQSHTISEFVEAFTRAQKTMGIEALFGYLGTLFCNTQYKNDIKTVHKFIEEHVEEALGSQEFTEPICFVQSAMQDLKVDADSMSTSSKLKRGVQSEALNVLLAGRDTTAALLGNTWWILSTRPEVWTKLQAEIRALGKEEPDYKELKSLRYLQGVILETLRLYPAVPINSRQALVDTILPLGGGCDGTAPIFVEKGQIVRWSVYAMHRRPDLYGADAEVFRPERWSKTLPLARGSAEGKPEESSFKVPSWAFLPFNGGQRKCIGQDHALTLAAYVTYRLCYKYTQIECLDQDTAWMESLGPVCSKWNGSNIELETS